MAQICDLQYLDNDLRKNSGHQLTNQMIINIQDAQHQKESFKIKIYSWIQVFQFKQKILALLNEQQLSTCNLKLFHKNIELKNQKKTLLDYNVNNGSIILIQRRNKIQQDSKGVINPYKIFDKNNEKASKLVVNSQSSINQGIIPSLTNQGTSGVYMIKDIENRPISIFKPFDQQVNAPNNPRGRVGKLGSDGISKGILSGQCATREVAAYLLDTEGGNYHCVPVTTYVQFYHPVFVFQQPINQCPISSGKREQLNLKSTKHGSLQQFVHNDGFIGDYGSNKFSAEQIHKIAILDIRLLNCDRNQQNILVRKEGSILKLIPIDHGLSFPDNLQIYEQSVLWMNYPQSKKPFSQEQLKFIEQIDPSRDIQVLESKLGFRQICLRNFKIAQIFLKKAAAMGFTLYQIGKMIYRTEDYQQQEQQKIKNKRSNLESIVMQAENLYLNAMQTIQKENIDPILENQRQYQEDLGFQFQDDQSQDNSVSNSTSTCQSIKQILSLRKKTSLPQLTRKDTKFHQQRSKARKQRQGVNGISKTIWNKYHQQEWNQLFYYYLSNLIDTLLLQRSIVKSRKLPQRSQSAK